MTAHEGEGLAPEGVAAPLEPTLTARQFWHEWRDSKDGEETFVKFWPDEISDIAANFAEAYAAAVSKNLCRQIPRIANF